jgi:chondroitin 4-sulfotransferase 11
MLAKIQKLFNSNSPIIKSRENDFIFIHINKTAGTSILNSLNIRKKQHLEAKEIIAKIGIEKWNNCYKFSIVRNPWDKVVSHYNYRVKTNQCLMNEKKISFKNWVSLTYGLNKDPFYYDNIKMFQSQSDWLKDNLGHINIDRIGKFENLVNDFKIIQQDLGLRGALEHKNKGVEKDYRKMYDNNTYEIVKQWFKEDIERFKYSFGNELN